MAPRLWRRYLVCGAVLTWRFAAHATTDWPPAVSAVAIVIAAFNNAGIVLYPIVLRWTIVVKADYVLLFTICVLCLLGNVLYPIVLRWTIVVLNWRAHEDASRKVGGPSAPHANVYSYALLWHGP